MCMTNYLKVNAIQITDTCNLVKKMTMTQKLVTFKRKSEIMTIIISILLENKLIKFCCKIKTSKFSN